jgi:hypothetical protein
LNFLVYVTPRKKTSVSPSAPRSFPYGPSKPVY